MTAERFASAEVDVLVRVSFLVRLLLLLVALLGFVDTTLTVEAAAAVVFLALTSMAGLAWPPAPALLQRHPSIAMLDALVMTALMVALGVDNPLVLVTLSSSVVVGVVLPPAPAALTALAVVAGYLVASLQRDAADRGFLADVGFPVTLVAVIVLGQAFRTTAERKRQSERAVADLVTGTATAQERARLARELHDSTAKTLQGLSLTARSLGHWIPRDPDRAVAEAQLIAADADEAVERLRQLLAALRQDDLGQPFHESLAAVARDVEQAHGTRVALDLEPVALSAPHVRYELLAAAREALVNAAVHSGAPRSSLRLRRLGEDVEVEVADTGRGFSPDVLPAREAAGHFGVRGYSERLALVGGRAEVTTSPGEGTRVVLRAPALGLLEVST